jgi:putative colanic acid biosynthesis acetyltransferase WcaF
MLPKSLWNPIGATLLRLTFHNWYGARRRILRAWGATLADATRIRASARISAPWNLTMGEESSIGNKAVIQADAPITIGRFVTISQHATLFASAMGPGAEAYAKHAGPAPITIADDAWISTDAFVGPGVNVGEGALLGSKASAFSDLDPWMIYGGDPARPLKARPPVIERLQGSKSPGLSDPPTR